MNAHSRESELAVVNLRRAFADNPWFSDIHWPENEERIRTMITDRVSRFPEGGRVLDVGCFNGYLSLLLKWSGFEVIGTDMEALDDRTRLFAQHGVIFREANLNDVDPFPFINPGTIDVVMLGEVIEHVLNYPLGLLRSLFAGLRLGGLMIVTTPNPSNFMNAARALLGRPLMWGTEQFVSTAKFDGKTIIYRGDIHYREYTTSELRELLEAAGFEVEAIHYMGMGISAQQPALKRWIKRNVIGRQLIKRRLFACTQYVVARKPS